MAQECADRLREVVAEREPKLRALSDNDAGSRPGGGAGWSKKQELGHLVDSAVNNRLRFNVAALQGQYAGPTYDGEGWVELGGYAQMPWTDIVDAWTVLNRAVAIAIERIPHERLSASCKVGDHDPVPLHSLIDDYLLHMQHHLDHILTR